MHLEGFGESLKGQRAFFVGSLRSPSTYAFIKSRVDVLESEVAYRGRKVLISSGATIPRSLMRLSWDAVFHVRDVQDLKLAMTYVQHMTKPGRLVWVGVEPPASTAQFLSRIEHLTWITVGEKAPLPAQMDAHAVFWPADAGAEDVEPFVSARMNESGARIRHILRELRASSVGLVWSSIGESDKRGALYWYDPAEAGSGKLSLDPEETADMLRTLADSLVNGGR